MAKNLKFLSPAFPKGFVQLLMWCHHMSPQVCRKIPGTAGLPVVSLSKGHVKDVLKMLCIICMACFVP